MQDVKMRLTALEERVRAVEILALSTVAAGDLLIEGFSEEVCGFVEGQAEGARKANDFSLVGHVNALLEQLRAVSDEPPSRN